MQWDASKNGGFTDDDVQPWMRTNTSTADINVAKQTTDKNSILAFWRQVCGLRRQYKDVLVDGIFEIVQDTGNEVFALFKRGQRRSAYVVCNFSANATEVPLADKMGLAELVTSNVKQSDGSATSTLQPWEGRLYLTA